MSIEKDIDTNLQPAIEFFKTQTELARALNVEPMTITQWKRRGIPAERARQICEASGGVIKPWEIKPKLFAPVAKAS